MTINVRIRYFVWMGNLEIRKAVPDDLPLFAKMEQDAATSRFIIPYTLQEHQARFADPKTVYLQILNNHVIVGFFILVLDPDGFSVEFRRIVVSEKGKGIGQLAICQMEAFCREELSRSRIWLDVFEYNLRGRHIYEKLGYSLYAKNSYEGKTLLLYEKRL